MCRSSVAPAASGEFHLLARDFHRSGQLRYENRKGRSVPELARCRHNGPVGEQFDSWLQMVDAPDGTRFVVEATRPKAGRGSTTIEVRTLAGLRRHQEFVSCDEAEIEERLGELTRAVESGMLH